MNAVMQMRETYAAHDNVQSILNQFSISTAELIDTLEIWRRRYVRQKFTS